MIAWGSVEITKVFLILFRISIQVKTASGKWSILFLIAYFKIILIENILIKK